MIIGIISDAHGNIFGLKETVFLLQKFNAEQIFFLGDAVNYFSKGKEVLEFLKLNQINCIKGNHEICLRDKTLPENTKKVYNIDLTRKMLTKDDYDFINSWQDCIEFSADNLKVLMVHASPFNYFDDYIYPDSDLSRFAELDFDVIFMGHTHIPFIRYLGKQCIVNVGSVGFCRDDGRLISCALLDTVKNETQIFQKEFPFEHLNELRPFHDDVKKVLRRSK